MFVNITKSQKMQLDILFNCISQHYTPTIDDQIEITVSEDQKYIVKKSALLLFLKEMLEVKNTGKDGIVKAVLRDNGQGYNIMMLVPSDKDFINSETHSLDILYNGMSEAIRIRNIALTSFSLLEDDNTVVQGNIDDNKVVVCTDTREILMSSEEEGCTRIQKYLQDTKGVLDRRLHYHATNLFSNVNYDFETIESSRLYIGYFICPAIQMREYSRESSILGNQQSCVLEDFKLVKIDTVFVREMLVIEVGLLRTLYNICQNLVPSIIQTKKSNVACALSLLNNMEEVRIEKCVNIMNKEICYLLKAIQAAEVPADLAQFINEILSHSCSMGKKYLHNYHSGLLQIRDLLEEYYAQVQQQRRNNFGTNSDNAETNVSENNIECEEDPSIQAWGYIHEIAGDILFFLRGIEYKSFIERNASINKALELLMSYNNFLMLEKKDTKFFQSISNLLLTSIDKNLSMSQRDNALKECIDLLESHYLVQGQDSTNNTYSSETQRDLRNSVEQSNALQSNIQESNVSTTEVQDNTVIDDSSVIGIEESSEIKMKACIQLLYMQSISEALALYMRELAQDTITIQELAVKLEALDIILSSDAIMTVELLKVCRDIDFLRGRIAKCVHSDVEQRVFEEEKGMVRMSLYLIHYAMKEIIDNTHWNNNGFGETVESFVAKCTFHEEEKKYIDEVVSFLKNLQLYPESEMLHMEMLRDLLKSLLQSLSEEFTQSRAESMSISLMVDMVVNIYDNMLAKMQDYIVCNKDNSILRIQEIQRGQQGMHKSAESLYAKGINIIHTVVSINTIYALNMLKELHSLGLTTAVPDNGELLIRESSREIAVADSGENVFSVVQPQYKELVMFCLLNSSINILYKYKNKFINKRNDSGDILCFSQIYFGCLYIILECMTKNNDTSQYVKIVLIIMQDIQNIQDNASSLEDMVNLISKLIEKIQQLACYDPYRTLMPQCLAKEKMLVNNAIQSLKEILRMVDVGANSVVSSSTRNDVRGKMLLLQESLTKDALYIKSEGCLEIVKEIIQVSIAQIDQLSYYTCNIVNDEQTIMLHMIISHALIGVSSLLSSTIVVEEEVFPDEESQEEERGTSPCEYKKIVTTFAVLSIIDTLNKLQNDFNDSKIEIDVVLNTLEALYCTIFAEENWHNMAEDGALLLSLAYSEINDGGVQSRQRISGIIRTASGKLLELISVSLHSIPKYDDNVHEISVLSKVLELCIKECRALNTDCEQSQDIFTIISMFTTLQDMCGEIETHEVLMIGRYTFMAAISQIRILFPNNVFIRQIDDRKKRALDNIIKNVQYTLSRITSNIEKPVIIEETAMAHTVMQSPASDARISPFASEEQEDMLTSIMLLILMSLSSLRDDMQNFEQQSVGDIIQFLEKLRMSIPQKYDDPMIRDSVAFYNKAISELHNLADNTVVLDQSAQIAQSKKIINSLIEEITGVLSLEKYNMLLLKERFCFSVQECNIIKNIIVKLIVIYNGYKRGCNTEGVVDKLYECISLLGINQSRDVSVVRSVLNMSIEFLKEHNSIEDFEANLYIIDHAQRALQCVVQYDQKMSDIIGSHIQLIFSIYRVRDILHNLCNMNAKTQDIIKIINILRKKHTGNDNCILVTEVLGIAIHSVKMIDDICSEGVQRASAVNKVITSAIEQLSCINMYMEQYVGDLNFTFSTAELLVINSAENKVFKVLSKYTIFSYNEREVIREIIEDVMLEVDALPDIIGKSRIKHVLNMTLNDLLLVNKGQNDKIIGRFLQDIGKQGIRVFDAMRCASADNVSSDLNTVEQVKESPTTVQEELLATQLTTSTVEATTLQTQSRDEQEEIVLNRCKVSVSLNLSVARYENSKTTAQVIKEALQKLKTLIDEVEYLEDVYEVSMMFRSLQSDISVTQSTSQGKAIMNGISMTIELLTYNPYYYVGYIRKFICSMKEELKTKDVSCQFNKSLVLLDTRLQKFTAISQEIVKKIVNSVQDKEDIYICRSIMSGIGVVVTGAIEKINNQCSKKANTLGFRRLFAMHTIDMGIRLIQALSNAMFCCGKTENIIVETLQNMISVLDVYYKDGVIKFDLCIMHDMYAILHNICEREMSANNREQILIVLDMLIENLPSKYHNLQALSRSCTINSSADAILVKAGNMLRDILVRIEKQNDVQHPVSIDSRAGLSMPEVQNAVLVSIEQGAGYGIEE